MLVGKPESTRSFVSTKPDSAFSTSAAINLPEGGRNEKEREIVDLSSTSLWSGLKAPPNLPHTKIAR